MKCCVTTLVSTNHYQYFIPTFVYTCKKYNQDVDIKIFIHGKLDEALRPYCGGAQIIEDMFTEFKNNTLVNSLRFLVPKHHFDGYSHVYFTDIDFVFLKQTKYMFHYFAERMAHAGAIYAGLKGTVTMPRIMGGFFMVKYKWFDKTEVMRGKYLKKLAKVKTVSPIYDELMLYDICRTSGLKVPVARRRFQDGTKFNPEYRNVHIGDFKLKRIMRKARKSGWYFCRQNKARYLKLLQDEGFRSVLRVAKQNKDTKLLFARAKECAKA